MTDLVSKLVEGRDVNRKSVFNAIMAILTGLLLVTLAFGAGFVVASFTSCTSNPFTLYKNSLDGPPASAQDVFQESWDLVRDEFYGTLPSEQVRVYGAIRGLLGTLDDPYTVFVEPIPHRFEQDNLRGSYGGVGMSLGQDAEGAIVLTPFPDSPAAEAGVREGDVLLAVDGVSLTPEMDLTNDIVAMIRGEVGTDVTLTVARGVEQLSFTLTRQVIQLPSVTWQVLKETVAGKPLGYLKVSGFTDRTADELKEGLDELFAAGMAGLVGDLRGNGGGLLQSAIDVSDQFLADGPILYESRRGQEDKTYSASAQGQALTVPLVLLVNGGTASASEIVAGALQDRGRATLIGEVTFGKGSVQLIFDLSDSSSLHVTVARWYTPNHHQLDGVGLQPDIAVLDDPENAVDDPLQQAIEFLQSQRESVMNDE